MTFKSQLKIDWRTASIALCRGKLARQARATFREGPGVLNGRHTKAPSLYWETSAADYGTTVIPKSEATMWRKVSKELPSAAVRMLDLFSSIDCRKPEQLSKI